MILDALTQDKHSFFAPEVVQTSAMDCGPAALKSLLEGFGINVSYGRLREACQTDVDGTSIDTIEEVAVQLGLNAEQVMVPADHLLLPNSDTLPALVVVRQPNGLTHFVVAWRVVGNYIQIMDPGTGRRWRTHRQFLDELYLHEQALPADMWREWAGTDGFTDPLRQRLRQLRLPEAEIDSYLAAALADPAWHSLAHLDAATRLVTSLINAKAVYSGDEATVLFQRYLSDPQTFAIPATYWSVRDEHPLLEVPDGQLVLRGAVLMRVLGRLDAAEAGDDDEAEEALPLPSELAAALAEEPTHPLREIGRLLLADGWLIPGIILLALFLSTFSVTIEAMLFNSLFAISQRLNFVSQRVGTIAVLFLFLGIAFLLEFPLANMQLRMGRRLETRLRIRFLEKIPKLGDRYFHSRLTSDMTQRAHELRQLRTLPGITIMWLRLGFQIVLTAVGVIWLNPGGVSLALLATAYAIGSAFVIQPVIIERDLVMRTHQGAISNFYLDALLGLAPIRTHGAEQAVRHQHEGLLTEWVNASYRFYNVDTVIELAQLFIGGAFSFWILYDYISKGGEASGVILLFYWTMRLPSLGQALAQQSLQYPMLRNRLLRLLEPLGAPEEAEEAQTGMPVVQGDAAGVAITMNDVLVQAGGHTILEDVNVTIAAGSHVAIVGPSGAGKSSLVGLLLGWHRPSVGELLVDGEPLSGQALYDLRRQTAWVDPSVQLWNRSLIDNLQYGANSGEPLSPVIDRADLFSVLEKLPNGLQTKLGEGGGLVSGGEGQRVRLGRALYRPDVRLVILDEPFRGLDRGKRRELLARVREQWREATLIFISHDVGEAQNFERVLVIEQGQVVEDDSPAALAEQPDSRFRALVTAEEMVRQGMWGAAGWRRLWLANGQLEERSGEPQEA